MKLFFEIAVRNIIRQKTRTILTFLILSFGVAFYIIMACILGGFDRATFQNMLDFQTGHMKIRSSNFDEEFPFRTDNLLNNSTEIKNRLQTLPFVTGTTDRIRYIAEIDNSIDSIPVIATGIDPVSDNKVFTLEKFIIKGSLKEKGALLGKKLAEDLGLSTGDIFYLTFKNSSGMFTSAEFLLTGILISADPVVNNSTVFISLNDAQKLLDTEGVSETGIRTNDFKKIIKYRETVRKNFPHLDIKTWQDLSSGYASLMATKKSAANYILFFITLIALVGIVNTILISVYEKKQEIGTLKALGLLNSEVKKIFIIEGFITGFAGSLFGLLIAAAVNLYMAEYGIDYTAMLEENSFGFNVIGIIKSTWETGSFIISLLLGTAAGTLASLYPAGKITRMQPADCLKTVQ